MGLVFDYVGRDVYSGESGRLGKVKGVVADPVYKTPDYLVIARPLADDVVVPIGVIRDSGQRLVVPYSEAFIDGAPKFDIEEDFSPTRRVSLDNYYIRRAS